MHQRFAISHAAFLSLLRPGQHAFSLARSNTDANQSTITPEKKTKQKSSTWLPHSETCSTLQTLGGLCARAARGFVEEPKLEESSNPQLQAGCIECCSRMNMEPRKRWPQTEMPGRCLPKTCPVGFPLVRRPCFGFHFRSNTVLTTRPKKGS